MSVQLHHKRNQYFITYWYKMPDGSRKQFTINNSEWKKNLIGKKQLEKMEEDLIAEDVKKRQLAIEMSKDSTTIYNVLENFYQDRLTIDKSQTALGKYKTLKQYLSINFDMNKPISVEFTPVKMVEFRNYLINQIDVSSTRINNIQRFVKNLIDYSADMDCMPYEYALKLTKQLKQVNKHEVSESDKAIDTDLIYTEEELNKFFNSFEKDDHDYKYKFLFQFMLYSGCRVGEVLAVRFCDCNINDCSVVINKTIDKGGLLSTCKNKFSNRIIYLPKEFMTELMTTYKKNMFISSDTEYLFFGTKPFSRSNAQRIMDRHSKMAGIKKLHLHSFRHSCASRLLAHNVDLLTISKYLGHNSIVTTQKVYCHLLPDTIKNNILNIPSL